MRILNISGIYAPINNPKDFVCLLLLQSFFLFLLFAHLLKQGTRFKSQIFPSSFNTLMLPSESIIRRAHEQPAVDEAGGLVCEQQAGHHLQLCWRRCLPTGATNQRTRTKPNVKF
jgi:hypothetical protein